MNRIYFVNQTVQLSTLAIENVITLLQEGATVPFIARYRKERSQGMDEVQITTVRDLSKKFDEILQKQQQIIQAATDQGKLNEELKNKVLTNFDLPSLDDLYLPFKQKRETRGAKARKLGLEPLAKIIMSQRSGDPFHLAERFVKGQVLSEEDALQGAQDIISEWMNESESVRSRLRNLYGRKAVLTSKIQKGKEEEGSKYRDYFDFSESVYKIPSHRFLALMRAEREGIVSIKAHPDTEEAVQLLERQFVRGSDLCSVLVAKTCKETYKRLLAPSMENELLATLREKADKDAISIFATNLRQLLLAAPLGAKRILAIDPGFRTGCKVVCLDEHGNLLTNTTIYPHPPQNDSSAAQAKIAQLIQAYKIDALAIGDGTAGRETEALIKKIRVDRDIEVFVVREDGASIYSASSIARKEFPDYDVTVRGAVSIGRRLMDPLAELVKIDPKSVGVGQYQHDVNQTLLKDALDDVVISCVNTVGVDLNTASPYLLSYVSGLGPTLAENIVSYRTEHGGFQSRAQLKEVKRLGDKAFEQAAGFLRVKNEKFPLDNSAVHPESYNSVEKIAKRIGLQVNDLIGNTHVLNELKEEDFPEIDVYTFKDILSELKKPGRDPRKQAKVLEFDKHIRTIQDLRIGMKLNGIVTNVTAFGAFVNIGIKENGLIHKSNLSNTFVEDPARFISLHEHVEVEIIEVDVQRKRIGLKKVV